MPPTYRRRTKSVQADEEEEDLDDPLAIAAEAETSVEDDEENSGDDQVIGDDQDVGGDQGAGDDQVGFGAAPVDPNDPMYDLYQDHLRQQQAQAQAAPVVGPPPPQQQLQQQPQVVIRAEDVEAAVRVIHGDDPAGINPGVQQAAAVATDRTVKPAKKSGTR